MNAVFSEPTWAIVELFGRQVIAGEISEVTIADSTMLRVDVPPVNDRKAYTKFYGGSAVYAITPTDQASGLHAARHLDKPPISEWTIPLRQIPAIMVDARDVKGEEDFFPDDGFIPEDEATDPDFGS